MEYQKRILLKRFKNTLRRYISYFFVFPASWVDAKLLYFFYFKEFISSFPNSAKKDSYGSRSNHRVQLKVQGSRCVARLDSEDILYYSGVAKQATKRWFKPARDEIVMDCGANVGFFSLLSARNGAKVISVEPSPETFQILKENSQLNKYDMACINSAVSNIEGEVNFHVDKTSSGLASLREDWLEKFHVHPETISTVKIKQERIDSILETCKYDKVDWLLIDVEGVEIEALEGADKTLHVTENAIIEVEHANERLVTRVMGEHGLELKDSEVEDQVNKFLFFTRRKV